MLVDERAVPVVTDPKALENAKADLAEFGGAVEFEADPYAAAAGADAIMLMTDWKAYPALDWKKIYDSMRHPALVYDTRNCLDAAALRGIGFNVMNVGK